MKFSDLKKRNILEETKLSLEKAAKTSEYEQDPRFWKLDTSFKTIDKAKARIRFLPESNENTSHIVKIYSHYGRHNGRTYLEYSPSSIGLPCPADEYSKDIFSKGGTIEDVKKVVRRNICFISSIYVVKDILHPENEGKVFLFKYGKSIYDFLLSQIKAPESVGLDESESAEEIYSPFDLFQGGFFDLIGAANGDKQINYMKSKFTKPSPLFKSEKEIEKVWASQMNPGTFLTEEEYLSYDVLKQKFDSFIGQTSGAELKMAKKKLKPMEKIEFKEMEETEEPEVDELDVNEVGVDELDDLEVEEIPQKPKSKSKDKKPTKPISKEEDKEDEEDEITFDDDEIPF